MTVDDAVLINDACLPELVNKSGKILGFYLDMFVIVLLSESLKNGWCSVNCSTCGTQGI